MCFGAILRGDKKGAEIFKNILIFLNIIRNKIIIPPGFGSSRVGYTCTMEAAMDLVLVAYGGAMVEEEPAIRDQLQLAGAELQPNCNQQ